MGRNLEGKVALVTGGARGIGRAICEKLASEGATVAMVDIMLDVAEKTASEFRANGQEAFAVAANVAKFEDAENAVKAVVEKYGKVDILVNTVVRPMMKNRFGRIVNISSVVGRMGNVGQANYSASKAGVLGLTKTTAREFASRNITANAVCPGYIATDMTEKLPQEARDAFLVNIPLKRAGKPSDVAGVVYFFCSPEADYVTGQVINCDGGFLM